VHGDEHFLGDIGGGLFSNTAGTEPVDLSVVLADELSQGFGVARFGLFRCGGHLSRSSELVFGTAGMVQRVFRFFSRSVRMRRVLDAEIRSLREKTKRTIWRRVHRIANP
jgi:hypothetical protein